MSSITILGEAERLFRLGFAIHWLHSKSKRPIDSGWGSGPRKSWAALSEQYREGFNIGVRLGESSAIADLGYLCVVDIDIKSTLDVHRKEALEAARKLLNGKHCPAVKSGRGNGSRHYYCLTVSPFKTFNPAASDERVKVHMPSKKASKKELETLAAEEIESGIRLSPAWEISLYSDGRQVVLPPSIHPDTGAEYIWARPLERVGDLPVIEFLIPEEGTLSSVERKTAVSALEDFEISHVDLNWLDGISEKIRKGILTGEGVADRSAFLLPASAALISAGCTKNEILSVLTDSKTYLGACAYEHAKTKSQARAAEWIWKYTLASVMRERSAEAAFKDVAVIEGRKLSDEEAAAQTATIEEDWQRELIKTRKGLVLDLLKNVHLILMKSFGPEVFKFNEFALIDEVWAENSWGAPIGSEFREYDVQRIKLWIAEVFGFQASDSNIWSAITNIAQGNCYHPVRKYLNELPEWDKTPRIDFFLEKYMKGKGPAKYIRAISRKFLCAMVARAFAPGIKFDYMLILEGHQGLRKSTAIQVLAGKRWFSDTSLNLASKDSISDMNGKWVMEQGEMDVLDKHDVKDLKQFVSRDTDRMRPPYGRKSQDYPRQCIFIGSTNEDIYLKDPTGNRRFWPFEVTAECDVASIERDRDQIFAEAVVVFKAGEQLWTDDAEVAHLARSEQEKRSFYDELTVVIGDWIEAQESKFDTYTSTYTLSINDLFAKWGPLENSSFSGLKPDMIGQKRVAEALKKLGYRRKILHEKGKSSRKWVRIITKEVI